MQALVVVVVATSSLSLLASLFIITSYCSFKRVTLTLTLTLTLPHYPQLRNLRTHLVLCLAIADVISDVSIFVPSEGIWCLAQAEFLQFGLIAKIYWTLAVALTLLAVVKQIPLWKLSSYHCSVWSVSVVLSVSYPAALLSMGSSRDFCWLLWKASNSGINSFVIRLAFFYVHLWAVICVTIYVHFHVRRFIEEVGAATRGYRSAALLPRSTHNRGAALTVGLLQYYPIALAVMWAPITTVRLWEVFSPVPYALVLVAKAFYTLDGFVNGVIFCLSDATQREWKLLLAYIYTHTCMRIPMPRLSSFNPDAFNYMYFNHQSEGRTKQSSISMVTPDRSPEKPPHTNE